MDINDHKNRITRMNRNSVITSLTCDDMTRCFLLLPVVFSKLRDKNLISLEEFILPVNFLKANDIIILSKPRTRDVFLFSGQL